MISSFLLWTFMYGLYPSYTINESITLSCTFTLYYLRAKVDTRTHNLFIYTQTSLLLRRQCTYFRCILLQLLKKATSFSRNKNTCSLSCSETGVSSSGLFEMACTKRCHGIIILYNCELFIGSILHSSLHHSNSQSTQKTMVICPHVQPSRRLNHWDTLAFKIDKVNSCLDSIINLHYRLRVKLPEGW